jgi:ribosomal protein S6
MADDFKSYEIAFLVKNPEDEKVLGDLIGQYKGNVLQKSALKETRLSYPIKKHASAYFGYIQFELAPMEMEKLSQSLKLNPAILRYLAVASPAVRSVEKRPVEEKKSVKPAAAVGSVLTNEALEEKLEEILK